MDWMIEANVSSNKLEAQLLTKQKNKKYVFLDIDEESYMQWGEPYHVPRDKLATLIDFAKDHVAKIIMVDIDLTNPGTNPQADEKLKTLLEHYPEDAPPLILIRRTKTQGNLEISRESFVESLTEKENIYWAHPIYLKDTYDQNIRRWLLFKTACQNEELKVIPSVQLAVDMLTQCSQRKLRLLENQLTSIPCTEEVTWSKQNLEYGVRTINLAAQGTEQRLIYTIPAPLNQAIDHTPMASIPAWSITKRSKDDTVDPSMINDKIVLIGASFEDNRDHHQTPIGEMPGTLVILNAIESLAEYGQMQQPPIWIHYLIELILILVMAWAFAQFNSFWGTLVSGGILLLFLLPFSFYFFKLGVWLDFALPLLGMLIHRMFADYEERLLMQKKLQRLQTQHNPTIDH